MPQSERSEMIKMMLAYINESPRGVPYHEAIRHVRFEISQMGARDKTIKEWIQSCLKTGLLTLSHNRLVTTELYKNWLHRGL